MKINDYANAENMHAQNAEKPSKFSKALRKEKASEQAETAEQVKKDSVEISREGRFAALQARPLESDILAQFNELKFAKEVDRQQFFEAEAEANGDDFLKKILNGDYGSLSKSDYASLNSILSEEQLAKLEQLEIKANINKAKVNSPGTMENFIFNALNGKVDNASDVAIHLANMIFDPRKIFTGAATIAGNCILNGGTMTRLDLNPDAIIITDPKEFEALAANREAGRDLAKYIAENYFDDPEEAKKFMEQMNKYIKNSELRDQGYTVWSVEMEPVKPQPPDNFHRLLEQKGYTNRYYELLQKVKPGYMGDEFYEWAKIWTEINDELFAYYEKNPAPYKVWESLTWEEHKELNCDPKFDMFSEENKAWYAGFLEKIKSAQSVFENAKLITDFSGNEKWNIVMNLLSNKIS